MVTDETWISAADRIALLRHGIVPVEVDATRLWVGVTGYGEDRVREVVGRRLGRAVTVDVLGNVPRRLEARRCVGHMERGPGRLELRFEIHEDEHLDDVVVEEDDRTVVVLATVCTPVGDASAIRYEVPAHVYLDDSLADRAVVDGATGKAVPHRNVYTELERDQAGRVRPERHLARGNDPAHGHG